MKKPDWEKEFDKRWYLFTKDGSMSFTTCGEEVKDFIRSTIQAEKEATKKESYELFDYFLKLNISELVANMETLDPEYKDDSELGDKE